MDALVAMATRPGCDLEGLAEAWQDHRERLSGRRRADEERWTTAEGLARFVETGFEQRARGWSDAQRLQACANLADPYGHALGCALAHALATCAAPEASAWGSRTLGEMLAGAAAAGAGGSASGKVHPDDEGR